MVTRDTGYKPISAYGIIGDMRSAALVGTDGSIDWCCFPRFDSPSLFGALLDRTRGGRLGIAPTGAFTAQQRYLPLTNILVTSFHTHRETGVVEVTDFMPALPEDPSIIAPHQIHRRVRCLRGKVELEIVFEPRFDYGRSRVTLEAHRCGITARDGREEVTLAGPESLDWVVRAEEARASSRVALSKGEHFWLVLQYDTADVHSIDEYRSVHLLEATADFWDLWARQISYEGPYRAEVERSALALKLLFYAPTGAVIAAPTTSLPEKIGGLRNWDYRYSWVRDAAFTLSAFHLLGHRSEADRFARYLLWVARKSERLQIMYGVGGETSLDETTLDHLEGYAGSAPVRIGNAAFAQLQLDVYGELLAAAFLWHAEHMITPELWELLVQLVDEVAERWHEPDFGIWEIRTEPRHYVHSKVMCWVALDRGLRMAEELGDQTRASRWREQRDAVDEQVMQLGWCEDKQAFRQHYETDALDAANLLIPVVGFLPGKHPRVRSTIAATLRELTRDGMVSRYTAPDGLPDGEGVFGICSFWLADALILAGDVAHGDRVFRRMLRQASQLGLYSEEIDPRTGDFLGNFPQAFTHIALINTAHLLADARVQRATSSAHNA
jgi:alpha,alpha-trehalase